MPAPIPGNRKIRIVPDLQVTNSGINSRQRSGMRPCLLGMAAWGQWFSVVFTMNVYSLMKKASGPENASILIIPMPSAIWKGSGSLFLKGEYKKLTSWEIRACWEPLPDFGPIKHWVIFICHLTV